MRHLRIIAKAMTDEYKTESLFVKLLDILLKKEVYYIVLDQENNVFIVGF